MKDIWHRKMSRRTLLRMAGATAAGTLLPWNLQGCSDDPDTFDHQGGNVIIRNGRVMDPLSGADGMSDVWIRNGKIYALPGLTGDPLTKAEEQWADLLPEIDAAGLVVAPGFVDIHAHEGFLDKTMEAFILDGVTTIIGGNCGDSYHPLEDAFARMESEGLLINYLSYTGANTLRALAGVPENRPAEENQIAAMTVMAEEEMRAGALGVSYGLEYQPAASWEEVLALGFAAGRHGGMTAAHARSGGLGQSALDAVEEMLRLARETGIPHQYSHIGSMLAYGNGMDEALDRLARAQAEGVRVTSDIYGYDAGMAGINASQLDPGVFDRFGCEPSDLEVLTDVVLDGSLVMVAGSRFVSREQYARIRQAFFENRLDGCPIIIAHTQKWAKIRLAMESPHVCICSDGAVYGSDDGQTFFSHPRVAGAFAVWLGRFVREEGVADLMTGLFKASTMAALILGLPGKGRVALGADADLTIFDPHTIIDRADYGENFMTPPDGIAYVLVNGVTTVSRGRLVPGVLAGRPVRRTWQVPGYRPGG